MCIISLISRVSGFLTNFVFPFNYTMLPIQCRKLFSFSPLICHFPSVRYIHFFSIRCVYSKWNKWKSLSEFRYKYLLRSVNCIYAPNVVSVGNLMRYCKHQLTNIVRRFVSDISSENLCKIPIGALLDIDMIRMSKYFRLCLMKMFIALSIFISLELGLALARSCRETYHFVKLMRWSTHWPIINEWVRHRIRFRIFQSIIRILQVIRSTYIESNNFVQWRIYSCLCAIWYTDGTSILTKFNWFTFHNFILLQFQENSYASKNFPWSESV